MNKEGALNPQKDMLPLAALFGGEADEDWWMQALAGLAGVSADDILSYELSTYPWEQGRSSAV